MSVLPNGYQMALYFVNDILLPTGGIVRFLVIYDVSIRCAPPHADFSLKC